MLNEEVRKRLFAQFEREAKEQFEWESLPFVVKLWLALKRVFGK